MLVVYNKYQSYNVQLSIWYIVFSYLFLYEADMHDGELVFVLSEELNSWLTIT